MNILTVKPGIAGTLQKEMDSLLNGLLDYEKGAYKTGYPAVDVTEQENSYILEADLPGYAENEIAIKLDKNLLIISSQVEKKDKEKYLMKERKRVNFSRSFVLPETADKEKIEASFSRGVLTLTFAKKAEAKPRKIEIKASATQDLNGNSGST